MKMMLNDKSAKKKERRVRFNLTPEGSTSKADYEKTSATSYVKPDVVRVED